MKTLRLTVLASVVAVLTGCPSGDKCKGVMCPTGQSCDPSSGMCVNGNAGGGSGGGNTGGGAGGGSGGGTIDAGPPIPLNMICDKIAEAFCDKQIRCGTTDIADRATCLTVNRESCIAARAVNAMVATYDGAAAAQCLGRFALTDCYDDELPADCDRAFVGGRGQAGNACVVSGDCQADAGLYCKAFLECGTCTAFSGPGQPCNDSSSSRPSTRCRAGLSCTSGTDGGGVCAAPQPVGQPCTTTGATTTNGYACALDAGYCPSAPADGGARLCQPYGMVGARCSSSTHCVGGLFCNTSPGDGGVALCENRRPADAPCSFDSDCQTGLFCPITSCQPLAADGQPCTGRFECAANYCNRNPRYYPSTDVLDGGARTCGYLALGDTCFIDPDCGPGRFCNGWHFPRSDAGYTFGMCTPADPDGGACTNLETLAADSCLNRDATCLDNKCVVTPPFSRTLGQSCDSRDQCGYPTKCDFADPFTLEGHCITSVRDAGEDCDFQTPNDCGPNQTCGLNDVCVPLARGGQVCDPDGDPPCTRFNDCIANPDGGADTICVPWSPVGGRCDVREGPDCYGSFCQADAGICVARQAPGAACTSTGQCASERCDNPDGGFRDSICIMACY